MVEATNRAPSALSAAASPGSPDDEYVIGPSDVLAIDVWKEEEISRVEPVRPDGKITLPLVGELQAGGATFAGATPESVIDKAIAGLENQLTELEAKYTPNYPDVVRARGQLTEWQAMRQQQKNTTSPTPSASSVPRVDPGAPNLAEIDSRLKAAAAEIAFHDRQVNLLRQRIADSQTRLRLTPLREEELAEVTRDDQNAREQYQSLLQKKMQSELATNLERREEGGRLRVIDPPSLPQKPVAPNRLEIVLAGWVMGLLAGVGLVAAEEVTDASLRSEADARQWIRFPVLARVPMLRSPAEERQWRWLRAGEIAGIVLLTLVSAGLGVFVCLAG